MSGTSYSVRLFLALWPHTTARNQLNKLAQQLENSCLGHRVRSENLHLTLVFIGETEQNNISNICQVASEIHLSSFNLSLDRIYFWKKARVVVAGASQYSTELAMLVQSLQRLLTTMNIQYDDSHAFTPHVTLLRNVRQCKLPNAIEAIEWPVVRWSLVQSHQTVHGLAYQFLADWMLKPQDFNEHHRT